MQLKRYLKIISVLLLSPFLFSCESEVSSSPPDSEPSQGSIIVKSIPENFKIYLNDRFTGSYTPDTLVFIEEVVHKIVLKKDLWFDTSLSVLASASEPPILDVNYIIEPRMYGSIELNSNPPGASIFLNDSLLAIVTPAVVKNLLPDRYKIRYRKERYMDDSALVDVASSRTSKLNMTLTDTTIWVNYNVNNSLLPQGFLTTIAVDKNDYIWIGTGDKGLVRFKNNRWEFYTTANTNLPDDRIKTIFVDSDDNKWIGTSGGGVAKFKDPNTIEVYNKSNSNLPNNYVNAFDEDIAGNLWIGTNSGLAKLTGEEIQVFDPSDRTLRMSGWINDVKATSFNDVYVAIDSFLTRFDGSSFFIYDPTNYNIPNSQAVGLDLTSDGVLWAGFTTEFVIDGPDIQGGIGFFDGSAWQSILVGSSRIIVNDLFIDRDDYIWLSTVEGLFKYRDLNSSDPFRTSNSDIQSSEISSVAEDSQGVLWIATYEGLTKYKKYLDN